MEALAMMVAAVVGFLAGGARETRASRRNGERAAMTVGVLRDLVAEHLGLARHRLDAAEARIALLEERLEFHDGFLRAPVRDRAAPIEPLASLVERAARAAWRASPAEPQGRRGDILPFPPTLSAAEQTPNPNR